MGEPAKIIQGAFLDERACREVWKRKAYRQHWCITCDVKKVVSLEYDAIIGSREEDIKNELLSRYPAPDYCTFVVRGPGKWGTDAYSSSFYVTKYPFFEGGAGSDELDYEALLQAVRTHGEVLVGQRRLRCLVENVLARDFDCSYGRVLTEDIIYRAPTTCSDYGRLIKNMRLAQSLTTRRDNEVRTAKYLQERAECKAKEANRKREEVSRLALVTTKRCKHLESLLQFLRNAYFKKVPEARGTIKFVNTHYHVSTSEHDLVNELAQMILFMKTTGKVFWRKYYESRCNSFRNYSPGQAKQAIRALFKEVRIYRYPSRNVKAFTISHQSEPNAMTPAVLTRRRMREFAKWLEQEHGYLKRRSRAVKAKQR